MSAAFARKLGPKPESPWQARPVTVEFRADKEDSSYPRCPGIEGGMAEVVSDQLVPIDVASTLKAKLDKVRIVTVPPAPSSLA
jgi:hypothetical protein